VKIIKIYLHTFQWQNYVFKIFSKWYFDFSFADNSDNVRLFKEKAMLKLISNLNVKSNKKKKTYLYSFKFQLPKFVSKCVCFIFTVWKIHSFHMQKCSWWHLGMLKYPTSNNCRIPYETLKSNDSHRPKNR
jgi:hypothetical protein